MIRFYPGSLFVKCPVLLRIRNWIPSYHQMSVNKCKYYNTKFDHISFPIQCELVSYPSQRDAIFQMLFLFPEFASICLGFLQKLLHSLELLTKPVILVC